MYRFWDSNAFSELLASTDTSAVTCNELKEQSVLELPTAVRQDMEHRLRLHLASKIGYSAPCYLASGGSAATYAVTTPFGKRAVKVYDPRFLTGPAAPAEQRRLALQRSLIGHSCDQLVTVYAVDESEGTAFIEMEFIEWPQLKSVAARVPDEAVSILIQELVSAVTYLERLQIVHRDIKPENIHVSPDFTHLKLLDLGVARAIDAHEDDSGQGTDHGDARPFIATAQYSSPEYLFRLDEPSPALWKALNIYQVGAVLHDLINKRPLFQDEVDKQNRWLVARAVLEKPPSFPDPDPSRLVRQKALAARCLAKDGNIRLQIASWSDFNLDAPADGIATLQARVSKQRGSLGAISLAASSGRLEFERRGFMKRLCDSVRLELIAACNQQIRLNMYAEEHTSPVVYVYDFSLANGLTIVCKVSSIWNDGIHARTATIMLEAALGLAGRPLPQTSVSALTSATIGESEELAMNDVANALGNIVAGAIDLSEAGAEPDSLHGTDLMFAFNSRGTH